jgi:hypothetical protein
MTLTPHQAKLFAHELTRLTSSGDPEKLIPLSLHQKVEIKYLSIERMYHNRERTTCIKIFQQSKKE